MPSRLTLLIPGLLGPWAGPPGPLAEGLDVPALERLLARGEPVPGVADSLEVLLFNAFGHDEPDADLPVGAVTAGVDLPDGPARPTPAGDGNGWWLRADPVHLRADRDTLVLTGHGDLGLTDEQAGRLVAELGEVFAPLGGRLYAGPAERWYLRLPKAPAIRTWPPSAVWGKGIRPYLPYGAAATRWHALMNEAQMQLNLSPVNRAREADGAVTANSLWLWGGGRPPRLARCWDAVWCSEVTGRGLARLSGSACRAVPQEGASRPVPDGEVLVVLDGPARALGCKDPVRWQTSVQAVHDRWLVPLVPAIGRGEIESLALITGSGTNYTLTRRADGRWWRRTRPLARYLTSG